VHCNKLSGEDLATILTHELMHGQFLLRHTFDDKYKKDLKQGVNPDNLMDYKGGTHIAKWQWDQIYDPAITTSLIKHDEEGEFVITTTAIITYLTKFGISTALNIGTDLLINRLVNPDVHSWEEAWEQVNCWRAMLNGAIDIIPAKKFKYAAEFVGGWVICLAETENLKFEDLGTCGIQSLVDLVFDEICSKQLDLAIKRIHQLWPNAKFTHPKLNKNQLANAPPVIPENNLHIKVDVDYNDYKYFRETLPANINESLAHEIHNLYKNHQWSKLEKIYNDLNINNGYPPTDGGYNTYSRIIEPGTKIDRYQANYNGEITGYYVSPLPVEGNRYSFESRSLQGTIDDYDVYYQIEVLKEIWVKESTVIPWYGHIGGGIQIKLPQNLSELEAQGVIRIINIERNIQ
jgi:hypothetical protein